MYEFIRAIREFATFALRVSDFDKDLMVKLIATCEVTVTSCTIAA